MASTKSVEDDSPDIMEDIVMTRMLLIDNGKSTETDSRALMKSYIKTVTTKNGADKESRTKKYGKLNQDLLKIQTEIMTSSRLLMTQHIESKLMKDSQLEIHQEVMRVKARLENLQPAHEKFQMLKKYFDKSASSIQSLQQEKKNLENELEKLKIRNLKQDSKLQMLEWATMNLVEDSKQCMQFEEEE